MLVLSGREVETLLDLDLLVEAVAAAMADLSGGRVSMPPRVAAEVSDHAGLLAAMPVYLPSASALAAKLVSVFPENSRLPTHQAVICCFDAATGKPTAVMDGGYVTAARTAAGSALATRLLARPDSEVAAVIGTGVQARAHARALDRWRPLEEIRLAGRNRQRVEALAAELAAELRAPVRAAGSYQEALRDADVVCATTHAPEPVVRREWLRPGTHVNSVGYNTAGAGEVDLDTIRNAVLVVELRAGALAPPPAGAVELHRAVDAGAIRPDHPMIELGELVTGTRAGRSSAEDVTLYKSVGVAVQDAAAAALVLRAAEKQGAGTVVEL